MRGAAVSSSWSLVTYANIVVSACSGQPALAVGLEMGRVDRGILVMPIDDKRSALHGDIRSSWTRLPLHGHVIECRCGGWRSELLAGKRRGGQRQQRENRGG